MGMPHNCQFSAFCYCLYHSNGYAPSLPVQCYITATACITAIVMSLHRLFQWYINLTDCITEMVMPPHCQFSFSIPATAPVSMLCVYPFIASTLLYSCHCLYHRYTVCYASSLPFQCSIDHAPLLPVQCSIPVTACIMAVVISLFRQLSAPFLSLPL
jgi:hypothetical protein